MTKEQIQARIDELVEKKHKLDFRAEIARFDAGLASDRVDYFKDNPELECGDIMDIWKEFEARWRRTHSIAASRSRLLDKSIETFREMLRIINSNETIRFSRDPE